MCKGMEIYTLNTEIKGAVTILRDMGIPDDDIFKQVSKTYNVTVEYVKEIMISKAV